MKKKFQTDVECLFCGDNIFDHEPIHAKGCLWQLQELVEAHVKFEKMLQKVGSNLDKNQKLLQKSSSRHTTITKTARKKRIKS